MAKQERVLTMCWTGSSPETINRAKNGGESEEMESEGEGEKWKKREIRD